jgi:hypothetical protein
VSAAPAAPAPDPSCRVLARSEFSLRGPGSEAVRLGGRLGLALREGRYGPVLAVDGDPGSPYALDDAPVHLTFDCDGIGYIVSVCTVEGDPAQVTGVVSPAEGWRRPCRG